MSLYRITGWIMLVTALYTLPAFSAERLTLNDAVNMALTKNPRIMAAQGDSRAAQAKAKGAGAPANPEILVTPGVAGASPTDEELFVSQPLEINGARSARKKTAAAEMRAAGASEQIVRREVARDTRLTYWDAVLARKIVEINGENVQMNETLHAAARRQLEVGSAPGAQVLKAEVELERARQEMARSESAYNTAVAALKTITGLAPDAELELVDELKYSPGTFEASEIASSALANRPELHESAASIDARKGEVDAAKAARRPDLAIQARQEEFGGEGGVALGFSLPIWDWGGSKAEQRRAQEAVKAQEHRLSAIKNDIALEVQTAVVKLTTADTLVKRYDQGILSQSQRLAEMAQKGYKTGATSYLDVLEAQRTLRTVRTEYYTALADHLKAMAELEWAAAVELSKSVEVKK